MFSLQFMLLNYFCKISTFFRWPRNKKNIQKKLNECHAPVTIQTQMKFKWAALFSLFTSFTCRSIKKREFNDCFCGWALIKFRIPFANIQIFGLQWSCLQKTFATLIYLCTTWGKFQIYVVQTGELLLENNVKQSFPCMGSVHQ